MQSTKSALKPHLALSTKSLSMKALPLRPSLIRTSIFRLELSTVISIRNNGSISEAWYGTMTLRACYWKTCMVTTTLLASGPNGLMLSSSVHLTVWRSAHILATFNFYMLWLHKSANQLRRQNRIWCCGLKSCTNLLAETKEYPRRINLLQDFQTISRPLLFPLDPQRWRTWFWLPHQVMDGWNLNAELWVSACIPFKTHMLLATCNVACSILRILRLVTGKVRNRLLL